MGDLKLSSLGRITQYSSVYDPSLCFTISRTGNRKELGIDGQLPFSGIDIWNAYELSWLDLQGKPAIAIAEFIIPCTSHNIIESKSFKLYLNSFNQTKFASKEAVKTLLIKDLSTAAGAAVQVKLMDPNEFGQQTFSEFAGTCLDNLPVHIEEYQVNSSYLLNSTEIVEETLYSNLFKSNCPITNQPDWASVLIHYHGHKIDHEGLLKYLVSFREHGEFHEQCVERIFVDILNYCKPEKLSVYARYTRRGGLDINPFRSNFESAPSNLRNFRQ